MKEIDSPKTINEILDKYSRLKYLIKRVYKLELEDITTLVVDGEGKKLDFITLKNKYRFKMKSADNVLSPSEEDPTIMHFSYDPGLYQSIQEIIKDYDI